MSVEFASYLSGRYVEINVYPFSFKEYIGYFNIEKYFKKHFLDYLELGGMVFTYDYPGDSRELVMNDLCNSIVLKDIIQRKNIKNIDLLDGLIRYIMYKVSQTFSANKVYNRLK